jgi:nifR3 family TIM-barrel protein
MQNVKPFSENLQKKIDGLLCQRESIKLGSVEFDSKLLLAPMAGICTAPFRLLMEDLGAGGTVSELISCHGINYENKKTLDMLYIDKDERNIGIQLFGEDADAFVKAIPTVLESNPKFVDINMGCPVRKVVTKGGGSSLLKDAKALGPFLTKIKKALPVPLTIKIRTGWDADQINADEVCRVAYDSGVEFVAIHGRTRAQQYEGLANWDYIEWLASDCPLPLIGNGDLHQPNQVRDRMSKSNCQAFMIARGALRNPFIFLESYISDDDKKRSIFLGQDYMEVIERLHGYTTEIYSDKRLGLVQMRKLIVWFAAGFPGAAKFRSGIFSSKELGETMDITREYFGNLGGAKKHINYNEVFMSSGHG